MLGVHELSSGYGNLDILEDVHIEVNSNEIVSILGSNGAGKSTLLRTIAGLLPDKKGTIQFNKENITKLATHQRVQKGVIYVPESRGIIADLTVLENLELGAFLWRKEKDKVQERIEEMLSLFPRLAERKIHKGSDLSGGEQQMVAIARGLMSRPKILMLDEPSLGLSPIVTKEIFKAIQLLRETGIAILMVEQNAKLALEISDRAYVLNHGRIVKHGNAKVIKEDPQIQKMYLGA